MLITIIHNYIHIHINIQIQKYQQYSISIYPHTNPKVSTMIYIQIQTTSPTQSASGFPDPHPSGTLSSSCAKVWILTFTFLFLCQGLNIHFHFIQQSDAQWRIGGCRNMRSKKDISQIIWSHLINFEAAVGLESWASNGFQLLHLVHPGLRGHNLVTTSNAWRQFSQLRGKTEQNRSQPAPSVHLGNSDHSLELRRNAFFTFESCLALCGIYVSLKSLDKW